MIFFASGRCKKQYHHLGNKTDLRSRNEMNKNVMVISQQILTYRVFE